MRKSEKKTKFQITNYKLQTKNNYRNSKSQTLAVFKKSGSTVLVIGFWNLRFIWILVLDIWNLIYRDAYREQIVI